MGEIATILQNAILYVAGTEGLEKFNRAGYDTGTQKIVHTDGSLDLPRLMNMLLDVFPEEQSSAITDNVLAKYVEMSSEEQKKAQVAVEDARMAVEDVRVEVPETGVSPATGLSYEDNLAQYLATDASDVRDLINEARRIREAMGKSTGNGQKAYEAPPQMPVRRESPVREFPAVERLEKPPHDMITVPRANFIPPVAEPAPLRPDPVDLSEQALEMEITRFVGERKVYTSLDIMDFIRYLKDKGYNFQENKILENVYTWLEERKSRERAALMADIQSFLARMPWPSESEVSSYCEQKKSEGIICESSEIKRMILVEMIRKH